MPYHVPYAIRNPCLIINYFININIDMAKKTLADKYNECYYNAAAATATATNVAATTNNNENIFFTFSLGINYNNNQKEDELEEYLRKPPVNPQTDPLQWWKVIN
jgi:hypothetical protein